MQQVYTNELRKCTVVYI